SLKKCAAPPRSPPERPAASMPRCAIREATSQDAPAILDCLREAFEPYRHDYTPGAFADTVLTPDALARRFVAMTILVATAEPDVIAGTIAVSVSAKEGHLRGMAVREAGQGRGIAAQLLKAAEALLHSQGVRRITLDTTEPLARAVAFYKKNGYSPTGRVQDFYGMPLHEFAKVLALD
ncbi:MAG: GNAT family N-acetyltransferase, partial [Acidobacteriaceae bacterium]